MGLSLLWSSEWVVCLWACPEGASQEGFFLAVSTLRAFPTPALGDCRSCGSSWDLYRRYQREEHRWRKCALAVSQGRAWERKDTEGVKGQLEGRRPSSASLSGRGALHTLELWLIWCFSSEEKYLRPSRHLYLLKTEVSKPYLLPRTYRLPVRAQGPLMLVRVWAGECLVGLNPVSVLWLWRAEAYLG